MGQRTQIVVRVKAVSSYSRKESVHYASYHNQWGLAKVQMKDVIRMLTYYNADYDNYELPKQLAKAWRLPQDEWCTDLTPEGVCDYLNHQDNNDGGIFLDLVAEDQEIVEGKMYIYSDPEASKHATDKVEGPISLSTYIRSNPHYYDKDFYKALIDICKYYNVEIVKGTVQC